MENETYIKNRLEQMKNRLTLTDKLLDLDTTNDLKCDFSSRVTWDMASIYILQIKDTFCKEAARYATDKAIQRVKDEIKKRDIIFKPSSKNSKFLGYSLNPNTEWELIFVPYRISEKGEEIDVINFAEGDAFFSEKINQEGLEKLVEYSIKNNKVCQFLGFFEEFNQSSEVYNPKTTFGLGEDYILYVPFVKVNVSIECQRREISVSNIKTKFLKAKGTFNERLHKKLIKSYDIAIPFEPHLIKKSYSCEEEITDVSKKEIYGKKKIFQKKIMWSFFEK